MNNREKVLMGVAGAALILGGAWFAYDKMSFGSAAASVNTEVAEDFFGDTGAGTVPPPPGVPSAVSGDALFAPQSEPMPLPPSAPGKALLPPPALPSDAPKYAYNPAVNRDPTLSVEEQKKVEAQRIAREKAALDAQRAAEKAAKDAAERERLRKEREEYLRNNPHLAIYDRLKMQGIIGVEVLINDKMYGVGATVLGAKITKITDNEVFFSYKGRTFSKKVN